MKGRLWAVATWMVVAIGETWSTGSCFTLADEAGANPVHQSIDQAISSTHFGQCATRASDQDFVRRIYLDLIGRSPSSAECRSFLDDDRSDKRSKLIDQLLASEEFNDFFAGVLDVMFMERRGGARVSQEAWLNFLRKSLQEQRSFDEIVREILMADGRGPVRGAAKFLLDRDVEPNALTRDISRIFLGRDLQCAQCHDHPNIADYYQSEYFGIYAFIHRSYLFEDAADNKKSYIGEKAEGNAEFKSVFSPEEEADLAQPRLLGGLSLDFEPRLEHEAAYLSEPNQNTAGVPRFSRRRQLAWLMTHPDNLQFARNAVNRLWAHMLGRGLVHPVDFHHSDNPPSHPALLDQLAKAFVRMDYDVREFLRQIALSETYQRSIEFPEGSQADAAEIEQRIASVQKELTSTEQALEMQQKLRKQPQQRLKAARARVDSVDELITATASEIAKVEKTLADLTQNQGAKRKSLDELRQQAQLLTTALKAAQEAAEALPDDNQLAQARDDYQRRAEELSKDVELLEKELKEIEGQLGTVRSQREELLATLALNKADRVALVDRLAEARGALRLVDSETARLKAQVSSCEQQLEGLEVERRYLSAVHLLEKETTQLSQLVAVAPEAEKQLAVERDRLSALTGRVQEEQQSLERLIDQLSANTEHLAAQEAPLQDLDRALESARQAAAELSDGTLDQAVSQIAEKRSQLARQLAESRVRAETLSEAIATARQNLERFEQSRIEAEKRLAELQAEVERRQQRLEAAREAEHEARVNLDLAAAERRSSWERRFVVRGLKPLTPEQMAGSTIAALELRDRFRREALAEWKQQHKDSSFDEGNAKHQQQLAALLDKRLDQVVSTYVSMFAAPAGAPQDVFSSTADQALFFSNDGRVQNWLRPVDGSLLGRLSKSDTFTRVADELVLAILSRRATPPETAEVVAALEKAEGQRRQALRDVAWGMLSSLEFRFNH